MTLKLTGAENAPYPDDRAFARLGLSDEEEKTLATLERRHRARERARDARGRFVAEQEPEPIFLPLVAFAAVCGVMLGIALVRWFG